ncbi:unnamed protein product [Orchesella dallaii]|uniref:CUB domain-containing protein n=1 Tax=Orchesella dallaii TaxID=48710 RepID=A0ABP1S032_9HEXA
MSEQKQNTPDALLPSSNALGNFMNSDKNGLFKKRELKALFGIVLLIVLGVVIIVFVSLPGSDKNPDHAVEDQDHTHVVKDKDHDHVDKHHDDHYDQAVSRHVELFSGSVPSGPPPSLTTCGSTINADQGTISYKDKQPYEAGELCTFIIRHGHSSIQFKLISHGISATDRNAIGIFVFNDNDGIGLVNASYFGPPNIINAKNFSGDVAIVTFTTKGNSGTGFIMSFEGVGGKKETLRGMDLVISSESASPFYLPLRSSYTMEKHCDIVVISDGTKVIPDTMPRSFVNLTVSQHFSRQQFCWDYLVIFNWERNNLRWDSKYCGNKWDRSNYGTHGLFIFIYYKSNWTSSGYATLNWERVGPKPKSMDLHGILPSANV